MSTPETQQGQDLADIEVPNPDTLLEEFAHSPVLKTFLISLIAHVVLIGLTSFGLYAAWAKHGIKMPGEISRIEKELAQQAEEERIAGEREARKAADAKRLAASGANEVTAEGQPDAPPAAGAAAVPTPGGVPTETQVEKPKDNFEGILDLD